MSPKALVLGACLEHNGGTHRAVSLWRTECPKNGRVTIVNVETLSCNDLEPAAQHRRSSVHRQFEGIFALVMATRPVSVG